MDVKFTNSWASFDLEKEAAEALVAQGCVLIAEHADTTGAPTACQALGVPCVGYNVSMNEVAPDSALTSSSNNWGIYNTYAVKSVIDGTPIDVDWCQGLAQGAVLITELNEKTVAEGTADKVAEVEAAIIDGSTHGIRHRHLHRGRREAGRPDRQQRRLREVRSLCLRWLLP